MVTRGIKEGTQTKSSVSNANAKFISLSKNTLAGRINVTKEIQITGLTSGIDYSLYCFVKYK
jgi:hypothetical protein